MLLSVVLDCTHREPLLHIIGDIEELAALVETARDPERLVIEKLHPLPHLDDFVLLKVYPAYKLILALYVEDSLEELDSFFLLQVGHAHDRDRVIILHLLVSLAFLHDKHEAQLRVTAELLHELSKLIAQRAIEEIYMLEHYGALFLDQKRVT